MTRSPLAEAPAVRLLFAAACFDAVLILAVVPAITLEIRKRISVDLPDAAVFGAVFLLLLLLYWFVFEILLGGLTLGRLAMGLRLRDRSGRRLTFLKGASRGLTKICSLGLSGVRFTRAAHHDRLVGAVWHSDIAPRPVNFGKWRLRVLTGAHAGRVLLVSSAAGYRDKRMIRIGRHPTWSDLRLENDAKVSQMHCILMQKGSAVQIVDGATSGSSNGTFIGKLRLKPGIRTDFGGTRRFMVADVLIEIER